MDFDSLKKEIDIFTSNDGKLGCANVYNSIDKSCCALGAIAYNRNPNLSDLDVRAYSILALELKPFFEYGFDDGFNNRKKSIIYSKFEDSDYDLGYDLALYCREKGYIK